LDKGGNSKGGENPKEGLTNPENPGGKGKGGSGGENPRGALLGLLTRTGHEPGGHPSRGG